MLSKTIAIGGIGISGFLNPSAATQRLSGKTRLFNVCGLRRNLSSNRRDAKFTERWRYVKRRVNNSN